MKQKTEFALLISATGMGDQICYIPILKKLKKRFGKFDILYWGNGPWWAKSNYGKTRIFPFFDEQEYIKNYIQMDSFLNKECPYNEIIFLSPRDPEWWKTPDHASISYLKELNLEYNDDTPEKEIEIILPEDRVNEYSYFNDYYVIAPCHNKMPYGRWFDLNIYSELIKQFNKNIKFVTLCDYPLPYESETFWTNNFDELQFFLKSVRGVVTIDSNIQHFCNALRTKALVLWGFNGPVVQQQNDGRGKYLYKSHINMFNEPAEFYSVQSTESAEYEDYYTRKNIDYNIFFESFEKLIKETYADI
jgi:ADP-heptose:LPS heptosyltransferase